MGCSSSLSKPGSWDTTTSLSSGHWRKKLSKNEYRKVYTLDGTIPSNASDGVLALRVFLEDPASIVKFAEFAKRRGKLSLLLCWIEVLEYKKIEGGNGYKLSQGSHIYHKYFKEDAVVQLGITSTHSEDDCDYIEAELVRVEADPDAKLPLGLFNRFGQECLMCIYEQLYEPYRQSKFYEVSLSLLKQQVNHVSVDDFEYMDFLGQGAFGLVVHCKKKSTGKHYAMKIQTKIGLLRAFSDSPQRVTYEKEALAKCHHPFIVSIDYAFQTPELAIVVTAFGTEPISEERVMFYAAELLLALNHIHELGLIYRDLKPANILLNSDGHIQLVDLGGVVDVSGQILGIGGYGSAVDVSNAENAILFAPSSAVSITCTLSKKYDSTLSNSNQHQQLFTPKERTSGAFLDNLAGSPISGEDVLDRATSIFGTSGFMAPEMLALLHQDVNEAIGYTKAVDYWSLGVVIYKLITGKLPFRNRYVSEFVAASNSLTDPPEYALFRDSLTKLSGVSDTCKQIMLELLTIDEKKRLGSAGIASVKKHPWFGQNKFGSMPWNLLGKKLVRPPGHSNAGAVPPIIASYVYPSFSAMLVDCNASGFTDYLPNEEQQKLFETWDYVAPHVLKVEVGAEEEEEKKYAGLLGLVTFSHSEANTDADHVSLQSMVSRQKPSLTAAKRGSNSSVTPAESLGSFGTTKSANSIVSIGNHLKTLDN